MHERAALGTGEHHRIELLLDVRVRAAQDQATARAAQGLVGRGGDHIGERHRVGVQAGGHQAGHMGHVHEQQRADLVADGAEACEVQVAAVGREARDHHLRLDGQRLRFQRVVVDQAGGRVDAVLFGMVELARETDLGAVGQVAAMGQAHAQDGVARLQQRHVDRGIGAGAGMRLHIGPGRAEQLLRALDGQGLGHIHVFAPAVIPLSGVALGVLVRQHAALGLHHQHAGVVLGGNQLQMVLLALGFRRHGGGEFGVEGGEFQGVLQVTDARAGAGRIVRVLGGADVRLATSMAPNATNAGGVGSGARKASPPDHTG